MGYWSDISMFFFIVLGLYTIGVVCVVKKHEMPKSKFYKNPIVISYTLVLTILATYRLVVEGIGGADAIQYIFFYEKCNSPSYANYPWFLHQDLLFRYTTKFLRLFSEDYHFYFWIVYSFNVFACIWFLVELLPKKTNPIPCILFIFIYWRSMSSIRSNTAAALMMIALIMLYKQKYRKAIVIALATVFVHKMSALYFLFFPFYYFSKRVKLSGTKFAFLMFVAISFASVAQKYFLDFTDNVELNGAYRSYAEISGANSFWENSWKIAFEQIMLGLFMFVLKPKIEKHRAAMNEKDSVRLNLIWHICLFDMMTIPINHVMGIWRGYEYFYLPRLVMWSEIVFLFTRSMPFALKIVSNFIVLVLFSSWMTFRFLHMWEDSALMPYIFEPLLSFI